MKYIKLFSDINRVRIIRLLMNKELCVCEIEGITKLSQTNVSNHLKKLRENGVIEVEKKNKWNYYKVSEEFLKRNKLVEYIKEIEEEVIKEDFYRFENELADMCNCEVQVKEK